MRNNKFFLMVLAFSLLIGLVVGVSAVTTTPFNTNFVKWTMCDQYNLSKWDCDAWWESETNPYYIPPSSEVNMSLIYERYYNKTDIENKLNSEFLNETEVKNLFASGGLGDNVSGNYYNKTELDEKLNELQKNLMVNFSDKFVEEDDLDSLDVKSSSSGGISDTTLLIGFGAIILIAIGFFFYTKNQSQKPDYNSTYGTVGQGKIQSKKDMELEKQIEDLKKEISGKTKTTNAEDVSNS